jgi:tetratricopeptide (TPR) repeat protein
MRHPLRTSRTVTSLNHRWWVVFLVTLVFAPWSGVHGSSSRLLERFFPAPSIEPVPSLALPALPTIPAAPKVSVDDHNRGVRANNQGVEALNAGDFSRAIALFEEACQFNPGAQGSWNNLLVALRREGRQHSRLLEVGRRLMAMSPQDAQPASIVGTHLLEKVKDARQALPYLARGMAPQSGCRRCRHCPCFGLRSRRIPFSCH